jgi:hypothetical protein
MVGSAHNATKTDFPDGRGCTRHPTQNRYLSLALPPLNASGDAKLFLAVTAAQTHPTTPSSSFPPSE